MNFSPLTWRGMSTVLSDDGLQFVIQDTPRQHTGVSGCIGCFESSYALLTFWM